jgi:hypothetical protein
MLTEVTLDRYVQVSLALEKTARDMHCPKEFIEQLSVLVAMVWRHDGRIPRAN